MRLLRLEITKLRHQKRTWFGYAALALVVIVGTVALALSDHWDMGNAELPIIGVIFDNGLAVPIVALVFLSPFLLPLTAAMVGAFTIAGEAESGTLRTILVRPVSRGSLLAAKGAVGVLYVASALALVFSVALLAGQIAFGIHDLSVPFFSFGVGDILARTAGAYALSLVAMAAVLALAMLVSTLANSSLTAAIVSLVLVMTFQVVIAFDFFAFLRPWLFARYFTAWTALFVRPVEWLEVWKALACCFAWTALFAGLAWLRFRRRDVTT